MVLYKRHISDFLVIDFNHIFIEGNQTAKE